MPLYDYKCKCGNVFEGYCQKPSMIHPTRTCPKCLETAKLVPISRPARRNPAHGIQR